MPSRRFLAALALMASACGTPSQTTELRNAVAATGARSAARGVAFRFAGRRAADVRLYELPSLDEVSWRFDTPGLVVARPIGFAADGDLIYALTPTAQVAVLDLTSGRARTADSQVTRAAVGPDGSLLIARKDGELAALAGRRVTPLARVGAGEIEAVFGATSGRVLAVTRGDSGRAIAATAGGALSAAHRLPGGPLAVAPWGDVAAVATDTGLIIADLLRDGPDRRIPIRGAALAVAFSSSGHRIYVATDRPALMVVDRLDLQRLPTIELPAPITELRPDPFGVWLVGRAADGLILIPQDGGAPRATPGDWADDLPAAAPDGTLLVRRGQDVVALDGATLDPRGRVRDAAHDRWLIVRWDPRRPALQVTAPAEGGRPPAAGREIFVQVSSTSNQQWADDLAEQLRVAGLRATVLPPEAAGDPYRVVLGPYRTREEAEDIGRKLGQAYWIFTRDAPPGPP